MLPVLGLCLLALLQVGLVVRDQVLVVHAAREAARSAAVDPSPSAAGLAAIAGSPGLDPERLAVSVVRRGGPGDTVEVRVDYRAPTEVPLVGALMGEPELRATAVMRVER